MAKYTGSVPKDENGVPIAGDVAISDKVSPITQTIGVTAALVDLSGCTTPVWLKSRISNTGKITLGETDGVVNEGDDAQVLYPGEYYPMMVNPATVLYAIGSAAGQVLEILPS